MPAEAEVSVAQAPPVGAPAETPPTVSTVTLNQDLSEALVRVGQGAPAIAKELEGLASAIKDLADVMTPAVPPAPSDPMDLDELEDDLTSLQNAFGSAGVNVPEVKAALALLGPFRVWRSKAAPRGEDREEVGVFLRLPGRLQAKLPSLGDRDGSPRHVTMLHVGELDRGGYQRVVDAVQRAAVSHDPAMVELADYGEFKNKEGETIPHLVPRAHGSWSLEDLHKVIRREVGREGIKPDHHEGPFKAHVTLSYGPLAGPRPEPDAFKARTIEVWGGRGGKFGRTVVELGTGNVRRWLPAQKDLGGTAGAPAPEPEQTGKALGVSLLFKAAARKEGEERTVFGIVLEPEVVDSQGEIYSAEEIRQSCYGFLEKYQQFGVQHRKIDPRILPLECYLAPVDFELEGRKIMQGTWLLRVRVLDDDLWQDIVSGRMTGFSIGGSAVKNPISGGAAA